MALAFLIHGTIADIDSTSADQPCHPATALIVEVGNEFSRVIVPSSVLQERLDLLCPGRPVRIVGELAAWSYAGRAHRVATDLRLEGPAN